MKKIFLTMVFGITCLCNAQIEELINGNVGIGTTSAIEGLEVNGNIRFTTAGDQGIYWGTTSQVKIKEGWGIELTGDDIHPVQILSSSFLLGYDQTSGVSRGTGNLFASGSVGIGTMNVESWKLAVNGNIRAKEIKIETEWADFVFEKDYNLPTLLEVEQHIKNKGHLKGIPSAKEVKENGIFLGEMNAKFLQKIEELTLYTIQQEKALKKQSKEIENLKLLVGRLLKKV